MVWAILGEEYHKAIDEIVASDSDRIIAVVGGAMLDDTLRRTLEDRFRQKKKMNEKLFRPTGPLGNLVPKIDLAFQLYVFERHVWNAFNGIAETRNFFAHRLSASFEARDQKLTDALAKLTLHQDRRFYPHPHTRADSEFEIERVETNRDTFLVNLKVGLIFLMADRLTHVTYTNTPIREGVLPLT